MINKPVERVLEKNLSWWTAIASCVVRSPPQPRHLLRLVLQPPHRHAQAQVRAQAQLLLLHAGKIERINQQFKRFEINKQQTKKELSFGDSKQTNKKQPTWDSSHCLAADLSHILAPIVRTPRAFRSWSGRAGICLTSISWSEKSATRCSNPFPLKNLDVSLAALQPITRRKSNIPAGYILLTEWINQQFSLTTCFGTSWMCQDDKFLVLVNWIHGNHSKTPKISTHHPK